MRKKYTFSLLVIVLLIAVAGCTLFDSSPKVSHVRGIVEEFGSGDAMVGVSVDLGGRRATTGSDGEFVFGEVEHGNYTLTVYDGDDIVHTLTVVVSGEVTEVNVIVGLDINMVVNGSFEDVDLETEFADGWEQRQYNAQIAFEMDNNVVRTGNYSIRLTGTQPSDTTTAPRGTPRRWVEFDEPTAGEAYRIGGWFQAEGLSDVTRVRIRYTFRDADGDIQLPDAPGFQVISPGEDHYDVVQHLLTIYPKSLSSGDWELIEAVIVPPHGAHRVLIEPLLWHSTGTVWWDDIFVEPID